MKVKILNNKGRSAPFVFCDICDAKIEKDDIAEYLIPKANEGNYVDVIVGHNQCTEAFENSEFEKTGELMGNMSLGYLIYSLVHNQGIDLEAEDKASEIRRRIA
jgi:hypothetical protein